jgi:hypothetical protein
MNSIKCPQCGLVSFATAEACKSCGHSFSARTATPARYYHVAAGYDFTSGPPRSRARLAAIVGAVLLVLIGVGIFFVQRKLAEYFDMTPIYAKTISESEQFKAPVTVRINRQQIAPTFGLIGNNIPAGIAVQEAYVLEAQGLLSLEIKTTEQRGEPFYNYSPNYDQRGYTSGYSQGPPKYLVTKTNHLLIRLTAKGQQEAVNWQETEEPYQFMNSSPQNISWWRVPIGEREFVRIESVSQRGKEAGKEFMYVEFIWRWRPNKLGEAFDMSSEAFRALPDKARAAATAARWNSQTEFRAHARMELFAGRWELAEIIFPNEMMNKIISGG